MERLKIRSSRLAHFTRAAQFSIDVNLPVPDAELTNPNFKGLHRQEGVMSFA